jgi:hypothetical protein
MNNRQKRILLMILSGILLLASGVYGQEYSEVPGELRSLSGRIRWNKAMGVLPKTPGSREAADNICAQFFVVVTRPATGSEKPIQYDIALEAKPEPDKPDHYSCAFEMQVPSNVFLAVHPGMGDGMAWPATQRAQFHYVHAWIDSGRTTRGGGQRTFSPEKRVNKLGKKGMYMTFELVYDHASSVNAPVQTGQASLVASQAIFPAPFHPQGFVVLTWDAGPDHPNADVWVKYNNSRDKVLLIKQPKGGQQVPVQRGQIYTYVLMDGRTVLATANVVAH